MLRRSLGTLAVLALLAVAAPSQAAPQPRLERQLLDYRYDGVGPALLSVEGEVEAKGRPGYFAIVNADDVGGELEPYFPEVFEIGDDGGPPHTYGSVGNRDLCASPVVTCERKAGSSSLSFGVSFSVGRSARPMHFRMLIALEGTRVSTSDAKLGWRVNKRKGGFTRVTSGGSGVRGAGVAGEAMPEATLRGGRKGSIAIAVPPCEDVGAGVVTLTGAKNAVSATCPTRSITAARRTSTTWSMTGPAAGLSAYATRLLVFDL